MEKQQTTAPQGSFLMVDKVLMARHGMEVACYMANLLDKYFYFDENFSENGGEFFLTHKAQTEQTGLTNYQLRRLKRYCIEQGWFCTRLKGSPAREWYDIDLEHPDIQSVIRKPKVKPFENRRSSPTVFGGSYKNNKERKTKVSSSSEEEEKDLFTGNDGITSGDITEDLFSEFWDMYPRKESQGQAMTYWKRLCRKKDRPQWNDIREALLVQRKTLRWQDRNHIPFPGKWINESRWLDDPKYMNPPYNQYPASVAGPRGAKKGKYDSYESDEKVIIRRNGTN